MKRNTTCPMPAEAFDYDQKGTAHQTMVWIALACVGITAISSLSLITLHLRRYRCPREQRQIIRIVFISVVYAVVSFFQIYDYELADYIAVIPDLYEAFCICALFLLYLQFAAPASTFGEEMFEAVRAAEEHHTGFDWPRITWIFVFQYPVTQLLATVITVATVAAKTYCSQSLSPRYGHLWAEIINSVGVGAAVLAVFRVYGHVKMIMKARRGLAKLVCFKVIVFISFVQTWIFNILLEHNVMKPSKTFSYDDLLYGIPALVLCCEMILFSLAFWYAYSSTEYSSDAKPRDHRLPIWKAVIDAMNPYDFLHGILQMFKLGLHLQKSGGFQEWSNAKAEAKAQKKQQGRGGPLGIIGAAGNRITMLRNQGRYQTMDGMESLSRPSQPHHYRNESQQSAADVATSYGPAQEYGIYQPPAGSPPGYDSQKTYLMADVSDARRSPSPSGRQTHSRSPSPSGRYGGYTQPRDMV